MNNSHTSNDLAKSFTPRKTLLQKLLGFSLFNTMSFHTRTARPKKESYIHPMIGGSALEIEEWNKAVDARNNLKLQRKLGLI